MATKALNYTTAEINQRLNLAGTAVQPSVLNDYYTKTEVDGKVVVDLSVRYSTSYANLSAVLTALNSDTAADATAIKKAGVSIKFINSSTNKYEQWNLKASSWSTNTSDWALDVDSYNIPLDNIEKENTQSAEQAIIYETDGGVEVGKIDSTGADFTNIKKGGKEVATKEYVDEHGGGAGDLPIEEEANFDKNGIEVKDGNQTVMKVTPNGLQAKQYYRIDGTLIERKPLRFALVTDIHYAIYTGAADQPVYRVRDGVTDDQRMQMWVDLVKDEMKNKNIDFILCTGDVVQGWYMQESREKLYNTFLSQLGLNFFAIDGNHDLGSNNPDYLQAFYNDKYFSFTCKDYYFICPDMYSHCIQPSGGWTDSFNDYIYRKENGTLVSTGVTHLEWMTAEANKAHALGKEIIIALHWYRRKNETTTSEATDADGTTIPVGTSMPNEVDMFTSWCHTHGVKYVLIGHQHSVECRQVNGIWHICAGWFAYRSDNYTMTTPWGIGIVEFANGVDKYTQITPEHVYSSRFDGDTVVIQPNNHPLYSRVEYTLNSNNILPTADMDVQSHSNFTNCITNQNN